MPIEPTSNQNVYYRGRLVDETVEYPGNSGWSRVASVAATPFLALGTVFTFGQNKTIREATKKQANYAWAGENRSYVPAESPESAKAPPYGSADRDDLREFYNSNRERFRYGNGDFGHEYMLFPEHGTMIFLPSGDQEKICLMRIWKTKDGKNITQENELEKAARAYMVAYGSLKESMGDKTYTDIVLDVHGKNAFGYNLEPNGGRTNFGIFSREGDALKIEDETWKEMQKFYDPQKGDEKAPIKGEKIKPHVGGDDDEPRLKKKPKPSNDLRKTPSEVFEKNESVFDHTPMETYLNEEDEYLIPNPNEDKYLDL